MMLSQPNFAGFSPRQFVQTVPLGMSLPMARKIARDSADKAIAPKAVLAWDATRENSKVMAFPATPENACNCVFRYPSQRSWPGTVPTAPAATLSTPCFVGADARVIADHKGVFDRQLRRVRSVAFSRHTQSGTRGKSRCEFSKLRRSQGSPSVALRPVATRHLNKACLALALVQVQPLSLAATPKQQQSLVQVPMCSTVRPIRNAATKLTSASFQTQPMMMTTKAPHGLGGFLLQRSLPEPSRLNKGSTLARKEGTFDVQ